jgi:hypothetical protein
LKRRPFVLTDLEDRGLAACDDQILPIRTAQSVLSRWFHRIIPTREMRKLYKNLAALGLLHTYVMRNGRAVRTPFLGRRTVSLSVRATAKGREYLTWPRRVI